MQDEFDLPPLECDLPALECDLPPLDCSLPPLGAGAIPPSVVRELERLQARLDAIEARRQAIAAVAALERYLIDRGVDPERASKAARKAERNGCGLCLARTRKGTPCIALGSGRGGRCRFHGGGSTGPKTPEGKRRSLEALARGRQTAAERRARKSPRGES